MAAVLLSQGYALRHIVIQISLHLFKIPSILFRIYFILNVNFTDNHWLILPINIPNLRVKSRIQLALVQLLGTVHAISELVRNSI